MNIYTEITNMDLKKIEITEKRKKYLKEYYEKYKETYFKQYREKNIKYYREYQRKYKKETRPKKFNWINIKNGNIHPKLFDEQNMFTFKDKVYIEKTKKEDYYNDLANKAEQKKYGRFN